MRIAGTYAVDQDAWKQAAQTLYHPFWDWAVKAVPPDKVLAMPQVVITGFNGQKVAVRNPLYHYTFTHNQVKLEPYTIPANTPVDQSTLGYNYPDSNGLDLSLVVQATTANSSYAGRPSSTACFRSHLGVRFLLVRLFLSVQLLQFQLIQITPVGPITSGGRGCCKFCAS